MKSLLDQAEDELAAARRACDEAFANRDGITVDYARKLHDRLEAAYLNLSRLRFEARKAKR